jgi:hypothetical protein
VAVSIQAMLSQKASRKWFLILGTSWLCLNLFDLGITFWAIEAGLAYEANRLMRPIISVPLLATLVKLGLAYLVLRLAERIECQTPYSSLPVLLATNLYIGLACVGTVMTVMGHPSGDWFHYLNPLGG